jgi:hypothetical protein
MNPLLQYARWPEPPTESFSPGYSPAAWNPKIGKPANLLQASGEFGRGQVIHRARLFRAGPVWTTSSDPKCASHPGQRSTKPFAHPRAVPQLSGQSVVFHRDDRSGGRESRSRRAAWDKTSEKLPGRPDARVCWHPGMPSAPCRPCGQPWKQACEKVVWHGPPPLLGLRARSCGFTGDPRVPER